MKLINGPREYMRPASILQLQWNNKSTKNAKE